VVQLAYYGGSSTSFARMTREKNPVSECSFETWADGANFMAGDAMPQYFRITLIVAGAIYTIASLVGLLGFLGAIFKKNGFVKTYFTLLCTVFLLQIASSIWYLVTFYKARGESGDDCLKNDNSPERVAFCNALEQLKKVPQGWAIAGAIVPVVIMACKLLSHSSETEMETHDRADCVYVVHHYIKRLNQQKLEKEQRYHKSAPSYTPGKGGNKEETHPLTQPTVTYPYSDSVNAFGTNKAAGYTPVASQRV
jgi:hypothetical protein